MSVAVRAPATRASNGAGPRAGVATPPPAIAFDHEEIVVRHGERSGCCVIVAVHSTALGPALGGVRLWHYPAAADAVADALRLARGMTMKAAVAGLDLGGGKGVIHAPGSRPPSGAERAEMLLDFGDLVESLDGRYITAEDVGISPRDMVEIGRRTPHLTGLPTDRGGSGDPSPLTAIGVEAAMRACVRDRFGARGLEGLRIGVIGLGHVGTSLARRLLEAGAHVVASDIAPGKRALARRLGLEWVEPGAAMTAEYDVLAPCALGGGSRRGHRRGAALRDRLRSGQQPARVRRARRAARGARDPLRARLRRQRGWADARLQGDPRLRRGRGDRSRAWDRDDRGADARVGATRRDDAAHGRRKARRRAARGGRRGRPGATLSGMHELWVIRAGQVPYEDARATQKRLEAARHAGEIPDVMLLLEHPPVYTKGRRSTADELPMGEDWYRMQGIEVRETDRGGRVTYHGPGQLVGYPIVDLRAVRRRRARVHPAHGARDDRRARRLRCRRRGRSRG